MTENQVLKILDDFKTQIKEMRIKYEAEIFELKNSKKFSEEDVKEAIRKTREKDQEKINSLTNTNKALEEDLIAVKEKLSNLQVSNNSLEEKLQAALSYEEIDKVLNGEITDTEIDSIVGNRQKTIRHIKE